MFNIYRTPSIAVPIALMLALSGLTVLLTARQAPVLFTVVSPVEGQSFDVGDSIHIEVTPSSGSSLRWIEVVSRAGTEYREPPASIDLRLPRKLAGSLRLRIQGQSSEGLIQTTYRTVSVGASDVRGLLVTPAQVELAMLTASDTSVRPAQVALTIEGLYADAVHRDVTTLGSLTYSSTNVRVATVDAAGIVRAVAPGQASVHIDLGTHHASIDVSVNVFDLHGDLDGDSDIDQDDVNIVVRARNTASTGPGDPRDLTNDGRIDALDARAVVNRCSRPRCTTL